MIASLWQCFHMKEDDEVREDFLEEVTSLLSLQLRESSVTPLFPEEKHHLIQSLQVYQVQGNNKNILAWKKGTVSQWDPEDQRSRDSDRGGKVRPPVGCRDA